MLDFGHCQKPVSVIHGNRIRTGGPRPVPFFYQNRLLMIQFFGIRTKSEIRSEHTLRNQASLGVYSLPYVASRQKA